MAPPNNPYDPNDPNNPQNQQGSASAQPQAGGQSVTQKIAQPPVVQGAPGTSQQLRGAQAVGQRKGSGFTGIGRIMQANVGGRLGQQVVGRIGQAGQQAQQQIGQAAQAFQTQFGQSQAQQGSAQGIATGALGQVFAPAPAVLPVQQPVSAIAPQFDPATVGAFQQATSGEYTGPTGLENLGDLQTQAYLAQQMGEAGGTAGGRMELLQRMYGRGPRQYSAAQAALDAMLLGKSAKELAAAKRDTAGISERLESEQEVAEAQAKQAGLEKQRSAKEILQKVGATEAQELARIGAQKQDYEKKIADLSKKVQEEVKSGTLSKETLDVVKQLGIDENSQFYGMSTEEIANMIATTSPAQLSEAAFANEEQIRKLNALRRLSGKEDVFSQTDVERAGTMRDPTAGFQFKGDLGTILQEQKKSFEGILGGVISESEKQKIQEYERARQAILSDKNLLAQEEARKARVKKAQETNQPIDWRDKESLIDQRLGAIAKAAGPFVTQGTGGNVADANLASKFLSGQLYDPVTGKLDTNFANELLRYFKGRREYKGRKGFLGTGGREYGAIEADKARIKALEKLLSGYGTGSTFKKKTE